MFCVRLTVTASASPVRNGRILVSRAYAWLRHADRHETVRLPTRFNSRRRLTWKKLAGQAEDPRRNSRGYIVTVRLLDASLCHPAACPASGQSADLCCLRGGFGASKPSQKCLVHTSALATCVLILGLPVVGIAVWPRSPLTSLWDLLRRRGMVLALVAVLFCTGLSGYTTFKLAIPDFVPFYADSSLADLDAWIHRRDPGMMLHQMVPLWVQLSTRHTLRADMVPTLVRTYGLSLPCLAMRNFNNDTSGPWLLRLFSVGTVLATALASVGPDLL